MAVAFTALFVAGSLALAATIGGGAAVIAASLGAGLLCVAIRVLVRAHRHVATLVARRDALARQRCK